MDDKFNEQKDTLIAIKKEISLLHQQVDYLIRNGKPLELLDLDVMMNRTHTIYDLMCGVEVGSEELGVRSEEEEELPVGLDEIKAMFGIEEKEGGLEDLEEREELEELELEDREDTEEREEHEEEEGNEPEEENDAYFIDEVEDEADEEALTEETLEETTNEEIASEEVINEEVGEIINEETATEERVSEETVNESVKAEEVETREAPFEDRGFILNFEPVDETVEEAVKEEETSVYTSGDEIEMTIPHLDFPEEAREDRETRDSREDRETRETRDEDLENNEVEEELGYEPVVIGSMEEKEDGGFELETPETLGERLQQEQDPTLADKLQHSALNSLQSAIGINDKFLFVNELFNGSMEKYNRSIANLDDLKTLNGALIYLNELRIELQWNSSNEAYKKLLELVHRKFGA